MFTKLANCFQTVQPNVADSSEHIFPLDDASEQLQGFSTLGFQRYEPEWMKVRFVVDKGGQSSQRPDFGRVRRSLEAVFDAANLDYDPLVTIYVGDHSSSAHIGFMIDPNDIDKLTQITSLNIDKSSQLRADALPLGKPLSSRHITVV